MKKANAFLIGFCYWEWKLKSWEYFNETWQVYVILHGDNDAVEKF